MGRGWLMGLGGRPERVRPDVTVLFGLRDGQTSDLYNQKAHCISPFWSWDSSVLSVPHRPRPYSEREPDCHWGAREADVPEPPDVVRAGQGHLPGTVPGVQTPKSLMGLGLMEQNLVTLGEGHEP